MESTRNFFVVYVLPNNITLSCFTKVQPLALLPEKSSYFFIIWIILQSKSSQITWLETDKVLAKEPHFFHVAQTRLLSQIALMEEGTDQFWAEMRTRRHYNVDMIGLCLGLPQFLWHDWWMVHQQRIPKSGAPDWVLHFSIELMLSSIMTWCCWYDLLLILCPICIPCYSHHFWKKEWWLVVACSQHWQLFTEVLWWWARQKNYDMIDSRLSYYHPFHIAPHTTRHHTRPTQHAIPGKSNDDCLHSTKIMIRHANSKSCFNSKIEIRESWFCW